MVPSLAFWLDFGITLNSTKLVFGRLNPKAEASYMDEPFSLATQLLGMAWLVCGVMAALRLIIFFVGATGYYACNGCDLDDQANWKLLKPACLWLLGVVVITLVGVVLPA
ncbi:MAG: hypothetical protein HY093_04770 [Candidatus Liptonbacteria bacterium]|nr:hypothetical protein [Candidatus Liptonbacteria bacterium]